MRSYAAKSDRALKLTVVLYPTFQIFLVPILLIGFSAVLAFPGVEPDSIVPYILVHVDLSTGAARPTLTPTLPGDACVARGAGGLGAMLTRTALRAQLQQPLQCLFLLVELFLGRRELGAHAA